MARTTRAFILFAAIALCSVSIIGGSVTAAAPSSDTAVVSMGVTPNGSGILSATIEDLTLPGVTSSLDDTFTTADLGLGVVDSRGQGAGWTVTISSADLTSTVDGVTSTIGASNLAVTSVTGLTRVKGQATTGITVASAGAGSLDSARVIASATQGRGNGEYVMTLGVRLDIPAGTIAGDYSAVLTVTVASGPTGS